ncbi:DegT/DnrJ/EryC1/StrS aminotransferase family protein, partial [gut metagenome]
MKVIDSHIAHHKHVQALYEELLKDVPGVRIHTQPQNGRYDSNYWLCAATLDPQVHIVGQENAYKEVVKTAVGGAAGVIHQVDSATTDCQPNENVEALRMFMLSKKIEARPTWKPMHKQPVYADAPVYTNGVEEELFKVGFCLPAGPYVTDDDVRYIVGCIKEL